MQKNFPTLTMIRDSSYFCLKHGKFIEFFWYTGCIKDFSLHKAYESSLLKQKRTSTWRGKYNVHRWMYTAVHEVYTAKRQEETISVCKKYYGPVSLWWQGMIRFFLSSWKDYWFYLVYINYNFLEVWQRINKIRIHYT